MDVIEDVKDYVSRSLRRVAEGPLESSAAEVLVARLICALVDCDVAGIAEVEKSIREHHDFPSVTFACSPFPLVHYAAVAQDASSMELLFFHERTFQVVAPLDANAVPTHPRHGGCTALHIAARLGSVGTAKVLCISGGNVRALRSRMITVLHDAVSAAAADLEATAPDPQESSLAPTVSFREEMRATVDRVARGISKKDRRKSKVSSFRGIARRRATSVVDDDEAVRERSFHRSKSIAFTDTGIVDARVAQMSHLNKWFATAVFLVKKGADADIHTVDQCPLSATALAILKKVVEASKQEGMKATGAGTPSPKKTEQAAWDTLLQHKRLYERVAPSYETAISKIVAERSRQHHLHRLNVLQANAPSVHRELPPVHDGDFVVVSLQHPIFQPSQPEPGRPHETAAFHASMDVGRSDVVCGVVRGHHLTEGMVEVQVESRFATRGSSAINVHLPHVKVVSSPIDIAVIRHRLRRDQGLSPKRM